MSFPRRRRESSLQFQICNFSLDPFTVNCGSGVNPVFTGMTKLDLLDFLSHFIFDFTIIILVCDSSAWEGREREERNKRKKIPLYKKNRRGTLISFGTDIIFWTKFHVKINIQQKPSTWKGSKISPES